MSASSPISARPEGVAGELAITAHILPDGDRLRTYLFWALCVGAAFFIVYPVTNWLTSLRSQPLHLYLAAELEVPLVPQLIWAYLSMYVLFFIPPFFLPAIRMPALGKQLILGTLISGLLFLLFPAELGFARVVPGEQPYAAIYAAMFSVDYPHNLVPSLHLFFSAAIALACADVARPFARAVLIAWLATISASTILVHQHHVLDLAAALVLVYLLRCKHKVPHA